MVGLQERRDNACLHRHRPSCFQHCGFLCQAPYCALLILIPSCPLVSINPQCVYMITSVTSTVKSTGSLLFPAYSPVMLLRDYFVFL